MTVPPFAYPAGNPDRFKAALKVKPVGIDKTGGMGDLAAKPDGIAAHRGQKRAPRLRDIARKTQIAHPVGRFGLLALEVARCFKGTMHVPQRASPAKARELQPRGRVAFGDRARLIEDRKSTRLNSSH